MILSMRVLLQVAENVLKLFMQASKDSLEQQLKTMNADVERMLRGFKVELSQLDLQMPHIKDAGTCSRSCCFSL